MQIRNTFGAEIASDPVQITRADGVVCWRFGDGRELPIIAGGSPDGDGGGGDGGSGDGGNGGAGGGGSADGGASGNGGSGSGDGDGDGDPKLRAAREESIAERKKRQETETALADAQKRLKELEDKDKSEVEKATGRAAELETENDALKSEIQRLRTSGTFTEEARRAGMKYPERAYRLVDGDSVEYDKATGEPTNAKTLVEKLKDEMPELFDSKRPAGNADGGQRGSSNGKTVQDGSRGIDRLRQVERKT